MKVLLSEKLEDTISETKLKIENLTQDLERVEGLMRRAQKVDLLWPYRLNVKNAVKSIEFARVLSVFKEKARISVSMVEVKLTTKELWSKLEVQRAGGIGIPSSKFRGYLNDMKGDLLHYDSIERKWQLTEKSIELLK